MHKFLQKVTNKSSEKSENPNKFKLLSDSPLDPDRDEEIRFKHKEMAQKIAETFQEAEPPFTVGLYGKWGTGKTTIAKFIEKGMGQNGFECFYFDAWKYEQDSLRRQFLIELDRQLPGEDLEYRNKLNQSLTKKEKTIGYRELLKKVSSDSLVQVIGLVTIIILLLLISTFFTDELISHDRFLFSVLFETGLLAVFVASILRSFDVVYGTVQEHRTDSAEGFETHFKDVLDKKALKDKTLFAVIDNIDRIEDSKKAANVLSDIKTFLSQDHGTDQKVLFLIPCDDEALKDHLRETYGNSTDVEEFLRKFFNLTVKIPKFIDIDLYEYIRSLIEETQVEEFNNDSDLEGVIAEALRNNPREIKQFINSLIPLVLLARERELQVVLKNIAFLAKLQIIRQKFSTLYNLLEEKALRGQVTLETEELIEDYEKKLQDQFGGTNNVAAKVEEFKTFNTNTPVNDNKNIDAFLTLRQLPEEKEIPEWSTYVVAAESGDTENAAKIVRSIKKSNKENEFDYFLKSRVRQLSSGVQLTAFASTTLKVLSKNKLPLKHFLAQAANNFPYQEEGLQKSYEKFEPELVFEFWYPEVNKEQKTRITNPFINLLGEGDDDHTDLNHEYAIRLLKTIASHPRIFQYRKRVIQKHVEKHLFQVPFILQFNNTEARSLFISSEAAAKFIESLNCEADEEKERDFDDAQKLEEILSLWHKMSLNKRGKENAFNKFKELAQALESSGEEDEKIVLAENLYTFTNQYKGFLDSEGHESSVITDISELSEMLARYFDQMDKQQRPKIVSTISLYCDINNNRNAGVLQNKIEDFIRESSDSTLIAAGKQNLRDWARLFPAVIAERGAVTPSLVMRDELYQLLERGHIQTLVMKMVEKGVNPKQVLKKTNYEVEDSDAVIQSFIDNMHRFDDTNDVRDLVNAMKKLGIEENDQLIDKLKHALIERKNSTLNKQEIVKIAKQTGRKKLFNSAQEQEIERS